MSVSLAAFGGKKHLPPLPPILAHCPDFTVRYPGEDEDKAPPEYWLLHGTCPSCGKTAGGSFVVGEAPIPEPDADSVCWLGSGITSWWCCGNCPMPEVRWALDALWAAYGEARAGLDLDDAPTLDETLNLEEPDHERRAPAQELSVWAKRCFRYSSMGARGGNVWSRKHHCGLFPCMTCASYKTVFAKNSYCWHSQFADMATVGSPLFDGARVVHYTVTPNYLHKPTLEERIKEARKKAKKAGEIFWYMCVTTFDDRVTWNQGAHRINHYFSSHPLSAKGDLWPARRLHPDDARAFCLNVLLRPTFVADCPSWSTNFAWKLPYPKGKPPKKKVEDEERADEDPYGLVVENIYLTGDLPVDITPLVQDRTQRLINEHVRAHDVLPDREKTIDLFVQAREWATADTPAKATTPRDR